MIDVEPLSRDEWLVTVAARTTTQHRVTERGGGRFSAVGFGRLIDRPPASKVREIASSFLH